MPHPKHPKRGRYPIDPTTHATPESVPASDAPAPPREGMTQSEVEEFVRRDGHWRAGEVSPRCICGHPESSHIPFPTCGDLGWYGCTQCTPPGIPTSNTPCKFFVRARPAQEATPPREPTRDEMLAALDSIGVRWMPDAEAGEGWASWTTNTDPHGEEPADSLADALATMLRASENDGKRATVDRLRDVLAAHWLTEVECHHEAKTDTAHCFCTVWASGALPSVGAAVDAWIAHVVEEAGK